MTKKVKTYHLLKITEFWDNKSGVIEFSATGIGKMDPSKAEYIFH